MNEMKDSGVNWIEEIPADWEIIPLKYIAEYIKGLPITKADLTDVGMPVVSYGQIHSKLNTGTHLQNELIRYVSVSFCDSNPAALGRNGDLFFADTSEDYEGVGNAVLIDTEDPVFAGYHTIIVRPSDAVNKKFFAYLCLSDCWRSQLRAIAAGIKVFSVTQSMLKRVSILIPTEQEQQRIASFLDNKCYQVDTLISNEKTQIEKLKAYKQSMITEVVTKGLDPSVPMKDSGVEWIGEIPETWSTIRVKQLLKERRERSVDGSEEPLSMSQKLGLVPTRMLDMIPNMASSFVGAKLTYVDDLVFNKLKAHLGVFSVSQYDGLVSPDYAVYYSTGMVHLKYLEYLFKTPQCISEFRKRSTGIAAGLTRLYTDGLFAIECPFPTVDEQNAIVEYLNIKCGQVEQLIAIKQKKIDKLNEYKRSLIYEYVTGKREVS